MKSKPVDILLVDDREDGLITLDAVLGGQGYNLVKALSGREALGLLNLYNFAVILLDVQMPGLDGFETAALIREQPNYQHVPILFITAINKDEYYIQRGYEAGAVDYIFKPFDPIILRAKVAVFVDLFLKTKQIQEQAEVIGKIRAREQLHELTRLEVENLRRYSNLADAIPHIVWKTSKDGTLTYCNQGWKTYTGSDFGKNGLTHWHDAFDPKDLHRLLKISLDSIETGESFSFESRIVRYDGELRWHFIKSVPDKDENGEVVGWIGTCTDIHDRKVAETRLVDAREQAEAASRAKTHFLANMSHEIRTPLNAILGFSELLLNPGMTANEKITSVSTIQRNGQQLLRIIDEVLDISKIEAGRLEIERTSVDLRDLFSELHSSLSLKALEKNLVLSMASKGPFPALIETDPVRLRQIIFNLVGNAIKFTQTGSVEVEVQWLGPAHSKLRIVVKDTGIGIEAHHAEKLFNPFVQADSSTTRRFGGTGLGLALSKKLAQALGGDVRLEESTLGSGSTFAIEIAPVVPEGTAFIHGFQQGLRRASGPSREMASLDGVRILLVEDAVDNQTLLTRFLQMAGASVELANNGQEAVQKAQAQAYDVVLMDIQMPVMDGYEATNHLRKNKYQVPIIALTAHALKEEREKSLRAGCNDHLTKPVERRALLESVSFYASQFKEMHLSESSGAAR